VPHEHGAYGQLLFPLVSALVVGEPAAAAYLLAVAGIAAFLGHEALLVLLGQRGSRAAREQRSAAWRSATIFGGLALVSGAAALALLPAWLLGALLIPFVLALVVGVFVARGRERTTAGEVLVASALSSLSLPVALAGGVSTSGATTLFAVFATVFALATVAVRALIGRTARAGGPPPVVAGVFTMGVVALLAVLAARGVLAAIAPYAALPVAAVALALTVRPPSPRHLRTIGWTLVGATAASAVLLVVALL
jgi:hypothetical protein